MNKGKIEIEIDTEIQLDATVQCEQSAIEDATRDQPEEGGETEIRKVLVQVSAKALRKAFAKLTEHHKDKDLTFIDLADSLSQREYRSLTKHCEEELNHERH